MAARVASSQPGRAASTTSSPAARRAWSSASSISASAGSRTRPTRRAGSVAGAKPGSRSAIPSMTPATSAAMGPMVSSVGASGKTPSSGTRPRVVFRPTTPQQAAGMRMDPPVSLPKATSDSPVPTATAEPLEDPPGTQRGSSGFVGVPNHGLMPVTPKASSCRLALPTMIACPAASAARVPARQAASLTAGVVAAAAAMTRDPSVVGTPAMSMRSLTATRWPELPDVSRRVMNVAAIVGSLAQRRTDHDHGAAPVARERFWYLNQL